MCCWPFSNQVLSAFAVCAAVESTATCDQVGICSCNEGEFFDGLHCHPLVGSRWEQLNSNWDKKLFREQNWDPGFAPGFETETMMIPREFMSASQSSNNRVNSASLAISVPEDVPTGPDSTAWAIANCQRTAAQDFPWWRVDFDYQVEIWSVTIMTRPDKGYLIGSNGFADFNTNIDIYIDDTICRSNVALNIHDTVKIPCVGRGRSIKLQQTQKQTRSMNFCQFDATGKILFKTHELSTNQVDLFWDRSDRSLLPYC